MKKNIFLSLVTLSASLFFTSCSEDDLKLDSPSNLSDNTFYKTESDFTTAIRGVYDGFRSVGFYGGSGSSQDMIIVGDLMSDNLVFNPQGRGGNKLASNFIYSGNNTPANIYQPAYIIISNANNVLAQIDVLPDGAFKSRIKAEALALRAMAHFNVARAYAKIPTQSADALGSLGIPYIKELNPSGVAERVKTVAEVYDLIISDLESALDGLPSANYSTAGPYTDTYYRLNKLSLQGILAKVYLYKGDYAKVISYAQPVVDAVKPTVAANLNSFWKTETNQGALFVLPFSRTNDLQLGTNYSQGTSERNYRMEYTVDKSLYDLFDPSTDSLRLNASIIRTTQDAYDPDNEIFAVKKYMNSRTGYNAGINDGRYLRVEEVILTLAEAQYLSGDRAGALVTLDILRDARYKSYTGGETGDELFDAIQLERRKELAFEGDRWYTIKRLLGVGGIPSQYSQGVVRSGNGYRADGGGAKPEALLLQSSSHLWQFPILQSILNVDPNIGQTPGY